MKKIILFASLLLLAACGPSKEEIEAREKAKADSVAKTIDKAFGSEETKTTAEDRKKRKFYASNTGLPIGIIDGGDYDEESDTYVITVRDANGVSTINKVTRETYLAVERGDEIVQ